MLKSRVRCIFSFLKDFYCCNNVFVSRFRIAKFLTVSCALIGCVCETSLLKHMTSLRSSEVPRAYPASQRVNLQHKGKVPALMWSTTLCLQYYGRHWLVPYSGNLTFCRCLRFCQGTAWSAQQTAFSLLCWHRNTKKKRPNHWHIQMSRPLERGGREVQNEHGWCTTLADVLKALNWFSERALQQLIPKGNHNHSSNDPTPSKLPRGCENASGLRGKDPKNKRTPTSAFC